MKKNINKWWLRFITLCGGCSVVRPSKVADDSLISAVWPFHIATMVSASMSALVALSLPKASCGVTAVAFCSYHSLLRLMNWLWGCCQCVCALGEGVPVTGGNPSYGIRPGATIVAVLQGALGAGGPGSSSDPHTAVTPLETQQHSPLRGPLIGSDKMTLCGVQQFCTEKLPDCAKLLLMAAVSKGQKRKTT